MSIRDKFNQAAEKHKLKKAEKEQERLRRRAEEERKEKEQLAAQKAAIEAEKQRLLALDDKEIMVELVFAVRGFYKKMTDLEDCIDEINNDIQSIEGRISYLEYEIENLKTSSSDDS